MMGGLLAAGFAGYIRLLERPPTAPVPHERDDDWEWIDGPEDREGGQR